MRKVHMNENRCDETPPFMIEMNRVIRFCAIRAQDVFGKRCPEYTRRHFTRFPHQQKDKEIHDQKNDREDVRTREHRPREVNSVSLVYGKYGGRRLRERRAAYVATGFARPNQRAAVATHGGATGIIWLIVRQGLCSATTRRCFWSDTACEVLTANESAGDLESGGESPHSKSKSTYLVH